MKPTKDSKEFESAVSVAEMRAADAYTIQNLVPSKELMYRAAMGLFNAAEWKDKRIAIVTGSGNNGGDGYALATILAERGIYPTLYRVSEKFSEDGAYYYDKATALSVSDRRFDMSSHFDGYDIVVDCLLGTGFSGEPTGLYARSIEMINKSGAYVISADINSGMNGDTGEASLAVKSNLTVSIGFYKKGMFLGNALEYIGDLINVDIGIKRI